MREDEDERMCRVREESEASSLYNGIGSQIFSFIPSANVKGNLIIASEEIYRGKEKYGYLPIYCLLLPGK